MDKKKRIAKPKLSLKKLTIKKVTQAQLNQAVGGYDTGYCTCRCSVCCTEYGKTCGACATNAPMCASLPNC